MWLTLGLFLLHSFFASALLLLLWMIMIRPRTNTPNIKRSESEKFFLTGTCGVPDRFPNLDDPWSVNLSIIVPAYQEEKRLGPMLDACMNYLDSRKRIREFKNFTYEIIIVSDGSTDKTVQVGLHYTDISGDDVVRVLALDRNRGKGGAVRMGVLSARGAVIMFADADGATNFEDLRYMEEALEHITHCDYVLEPNKAAAARAMVCGSRANPKSIVRRSFGRKSQTFIFRQFVKFITKSSVSDTQCGFKLFTRSAARSLFKNMYIEDWAFDVELLFLAEELKIKTKEVPVTWTEKKGSKLAPFISVSKMVLDLGCMWIYYATGIWTTNRDL